MCQLRLRILSEPKAVERAGAWLYREGNLIRMAKTAREKFVDLLFQPLKMLVATHLLNFIASAALKAVLYNSTCKSVVSWRR